MGKFVEKKEKFSFWRFLLTAVLSLHAIAFCVLVLGWSLTHVGVPGNTAQSSAVELGVLDRFNMKMTNQISSALEGVLSIEKVYWLSDDDQVAPEPNPDNYGTTRDPASMQAFLDEAKEKLGVEDTLFSTDVKLMAGTEITYYLDETILVITWKQVINNSVYTFSEVKITDPSQFRRYLSGGEYGSGKLAIPTELANNVNAIVASSGDYYQFRNAGVIVYEGKVYRVAEGADTCYIDTRGNLHFTPQSQKMTMESAQKFVDENEILFSVAFGPILVRDGEKYQFGAYGLGEVNDQFARAALCQLDDLHYLLMNANAEGAYNSYQNMYQFADVVYRTGCRDAYALDGGQTAVIVMDGELINRVTHGYQRKISDIIYFATAVPD